MIHAQVKFVLGLNGPVLVNTTLSLDSVVVGGVCGPFGTRHLLQMGRHFDHYYDSLRQIPVWQTRGIYSGLPSFRREFKAHSNDVKGQFGECIGALIMRRIVGLSTSEIEPLVVDTNRKTPDFRVSWQNASLLLHEQSSLLSIPTEWPLECKATPKESSSRKGFYAGLPQLATYWLLRGPQVQTVIGFGLICVGYNDLKDFTIHVVVPDQQNRIEEIINDFQDRKYTRTRLKEYQKKFSSDTFEVRTHLRNCEEGD